MPKRIQRQRTKGWRMPEGAMYVGRPTMFGNPYDVKIFGIEQSLRLFKKTALGCWNPRLVDDDAGGNVLRKAYVLHGDWLKRINHRPVENIAILRGLDLCCWCPLDQPCHADILLEMANR